MNEDLDKERMLARCLLDAPEQRLVVKDLLDNAEIMQAYYPTGELQVLSSMERRFHADLCWLEKQGYAQRVVRDGRTVIWGPTNTTKDFSEGLTYAASFALLVAEDYIRSVAPPSVAKILDQARTRFESYAPVKGLLQNRIKLVERGPTHVRLEVNDDVMAVVTSVLSEESIKAISFEYRNPLEDAPRKLVVAPSSMVVCQRVPYLIGKVISDDKGQIEAGKLGAFKIHRMAKAQITEDTVVELDTGALSHFLSSELGIEGRQSQEQKTTVAFILSKEAGEYLVDHPLVGQQLIKPTGDGRLMVVAEVPRTKFLKAWLLSFGDDVEVIYPPDLRQDMADTLARAAANHMGEPTPRTQET